MNVRLPNALLLTTLAAGGCEAAAPADDPPIACRRDALDAAERQRHGALLVELPALMTGRAETDDGFVVRLRPESQAFRTVAEWITLERRCCPFLTFELGWRVGEDAPTLRLGGGRGVKEFLAATLAGGA